jgi:phospholipase C
MRIPNAGSRLQLAAVFCTAALATGAAQTATPFQTTTPIKHMVVIFQENVSFDHYFATYPVAQNPGNVPPFVPGPRTPNVNGLSGPLLTNNPNAVQPFLIPRQYAVVCDQSHSYTGEQKAMDGGLMDQFVSNDGTTQKGCRDLGKGQGLVMGYYDGNTVTGIWNYAQHLAMSDNFYSTTFGPSTLGHFNLVSGQTNKATIVHDSGTAAAALLNGTVINDILPAFDDCVAPTANTISMSGPNVGDLLNKQGITWGWFQGGFAPSSRNSDGTAVCATTHNQFDGTPSSADYIANHHPFQYYQSRANPHHTAASSVAMIGQTDGANHQYDIADFYITMRAGNLPAVTFLKAPAYEDGHAMYSNPIDEQTFLVNTISALEDSPF